MQELFYAGGSEFMGTLTILFIISTLWIIYHFLQAYISKEVKQEKILKRIEYGKSLGLFTLIVSILGQLIGFIAMFSAIEQAQGCDYGNVIGAIKQTLICPIFGIIIYLFTLMLWFTSSLIIEKKSLNSSHNK